jgi:transcriptional regulator with XRE-family HTH domain
MKIVQHGVGASTYVAEEFEAEDIGAPFKIVLHKAVKVTKNDQTGKIVSYAIPDLDGLIAAVVITRILHPRKLFGADIKFIRKAISLKQKELASKLEMSTEHLSRCETGAVVMAASSEKLLRILSLKYAIKLHSMKSGEMKTKFEDAVDRLFDAIKPTPVHDVEDILELHFYRPRASRADVGPHDSDDGPWEADKSAA